MRSTCAVTLAATMCIALPARADFDFSRGFARARKEQRHALVLAGTGAAFSAISVGGLVVALSASSCGGDIGGWVCAIARIETGSSIGIGGAIVALPLVSAGVTLYRVSVHDLASEPPHNRRARGRAIAIAGAALTAAAALFGGLAYYYGLDAKPYDSTTWATMTALGVLHAAVGLPLFGVGVALYSTGR